MQIPPDKRRAVWISLALAAVTFAVYAQGLRCQFLTFDDQAYVTENRHVLPGITLAGIKWAFTSVTAGNWHPLTMLSHMLDCQVYGLRPWGHHLTNILIHTANTVLLFLVLTQMTGAIWRSASVALLFAVHPAHVESVEWIAERKDVLCAFFFLLAIWAYAKAQTSNAKFRYGWVLVLYVLALMSKPMAVTFPCVVLLLDLWPLQRVRGLDWPVWLRLVMEKWPLFWLSALWCGITVWAQSKGEAVASGSVLPVGERIIHAMVSYFDYLGVLVFPRHLSIYYPYIHHEPLILGIATGAALVLLTFAALACAKRLPWLPVGWLWFLGMLIPVIGLVQVGGQGWADRYLYLPCIGFFVVVVWAVAEIARRLPVVKLLIPVAALAFAAVTSVELKYWRDTATLFGRALEVTDNNYLAMTLVGSMKAEKGQLDDAITLYRKALSIKPTYPEGHFFLGRALEQKGQTAEALDEFKKALRLRPEFDAANIMVGLALAKEGKFDDAVAHYKVALKDNPDSAAAESDWGMAMMKEGQWKESIAHYEQALRLDPDLAEAHNNLAIGYLQAGRVADGIAQLRAALKLNPADTETQYNLAQALNQEQQWPAAAEILKPLAAARPADSKVQFQFGLALEHLGQTRDAMSHYAAALLKNPDYVDALQHLAWIAATDSRPELRNGNEAVELASHACDLTEQKRPAILLTLSAAYAEAGRYLDALSTATRAEELAKAQGQRELEAEAVQFRGLFKAGKTYHGHAD
ncbi:MAG TPA: tetratricopeptide repeat protein [Verrucomicrobiae bacterium]|nr:tetratricopeptide repeat protein [Verrucomicrobiae bacterium]